MSYRLTLRNVRLPLVLSLAAATVALGCGSGSDSSGGTGTVRVSLTDAPACGYDAVNVTVSKVRIHRSEGAAEGDPGWSEIAVTPSKIDLLSLQNGVLETLGDVRLEAGRYSQVRLVLEPNGAGSPANSIVLTDDPAKAEIPLRTPSGQQSGLKLVHGFEVAAGESMDLVLDFDACRSVVKAGNSGHYNLKPVISVIPVGAAGGLAIDGVLNGGAGALVSAQGRDAEGNPIVLRATTADAQGAYRLSPLPPPAGGDYALVVVKPGFATVVVKGVPVTGGTATTLPAIDLVPAPDGSEASVYGSVTTPLSLEDRVVRVRAIRTVAEVPVEVASTAASAGGYALALSTAPARVADHAVGALAFTEADVAATYELQAAIDDEPGVPAQKAALDLEAGADVRQDFEFPEP